MTFEITEFEQCPIKLKKIDYFSMISFQILLIKDFVVLKIDLDLLVHLS